MGTDIEQLVVDAWNKIHAVYRIQVQWGIGGLKQKWRRLMKRFDNRRPQFGLFFEAAAKLTNFLHRRRMNSNQVLPEEQEQNKDEYVWAGDF